MKSTANVTAVANRNGMRTSLAAACAAFRRRQRVARLRPGELYHSHGRHANRQESGVSWISLNLIGLFFSNLLLFLSLPSGRASPSVRHNEP